MGTPGKAIRDMASEMSDFEVIVLDGRGGGPGFCVTCDRQEAAGLSMDAELTQLGREVRDWARVIRPELFPSR